VLPLKISPLALGLGLVLFALVVGSAALELVLLVLERLL